MVKKRVYGEIPGFPEGSEFPDRAALQQAGVHAPGQAGISGGKDGADSIVVSGGYPDDKDYGDEIVYTGQGGQDSSTKRQIADQELTRGNIGLARSQIDQRPVRVIRGAGGDPACSPERGYRYDGLFEVLDLWHETGRDGFLIWRFRLVKRSGTPPPVSFDRPSSGPARRTSYSGDRIVRDRSIADRVKELHQHRCQVCGIQLVIAAGPYAEGAHIRGLGRPHNGPDHVSNMLCLCPNDHFLFDAGALYVDTDWQVWNSNTGSLIGPLRRVSKHVIDREHLDYHRQHYASGSGGPRA